MLLFYFYYRQVQVFMCCAVDCQSRTGLEGTATPHDRYYIMLFFDGTY